MIKDVKVHLSHKLEPENYTLNAVYKNGLGKNFGAWIGEIKSNTLGFTVLD